MVRKGSMVNALVILTTLFGVGAASKHWTGRPKWQNKAAMARYLVRNADWTILSITSKRFQQPVGNIQSFVDGPIGGSTGIPYFYIAAMEDAYRDLRHNNTVSLFVTEQMSDYCETRGLDPEEPICARVMLTGHLVKVEDQSELRFAKAALFQRHPAMTGWPIGHSWYVYKIDLTMVYILDYYGGGTIVPLEDYFNAK